MGVHELWPILEPVKKHVPLQSLSGMTLAVDLSIWVCEAQSVKQMIGVVAKPHLRNLFFRVSSLSLMGVKLVFVTEGEAPKVKADTMNKRNANRYGPSNKPPPSRPGRSYFKSVLKEVCSYCVSGHLHWLVRNDGTRVYVYPGSKCLRMLDCLGVPWVQAAGEAEAMCAYLNAKGHVDGCITNDGDVFLYGAQTVYRNFTMNVKDPHVDCYEASAINDKLGLDRESLVSLAILLGCDYVPKGLPGIGREMALKFIRSLTRESVLQRFYQWRKEFDDPTVPPKSAKKTAHCSVCCHPGSAKEHQRKGCSLCASDRYCEPHDYDYCCPCEWHMAEQEKKKNPLEYTFKTKARKREGFPYHEVIQEFLVNKDKLSKVIRWLRPSLPCFQNFALEWMDWPKHYSCEKILVLLTYYDMHERKAGRQHDAQLQATRIVKTRVRNGVPCLEIEWVKPGSYVFPDDHPPDAPLLSIEEESLFTAAYPDIVELFRKDKMEAELLKLKSKKSKPTSKVLPNVDDVASLLSEMSLVPAAEKSPPSQAPVFSVDDDPLPTISLGDSHGLLFSSESSRSPLTVFPDETDLNCPTTSLFNKDDSATPNKPCSFPVIGSRQELLVSSPNISSLVSDLHLSNIDWEATSFSRSPQTESCTSCKETHSSEDKAAVPGSRIAALANLNQETVTPCKPILQETADRAPALTLDSPCMSYLEKLPLRERILLRNARQTVSLNPEKLNVNKPLAPIDVNPQKLKVKNLPLAPVDLKPNKLNGKNLPLGHVDLNPQNLNGKNLPLAAVDLNPTKRNGKNLPLGHVVLNPQNLNGKNLPLGHVDLNPQNLNGKNLSLAAVDLNPTKLNWKNLPLGHVELNPQNLYEKNPPLGYVDLNPQNPNGKNVPLGHVDLNPQNLNGKNLPLGHVDLNQHNLNEKTLPLGYAVLNPQNLNEKNLPLVSVSNVLQKPNLTKPISDQRCVNIKENVPIHSKLLKQPSPQKRKTHNTQVTKLAGTSSSSQVFQHPTTKSFTFVKKSTLATVRNLSDCSLTISVAPKAETKPLIKKSVCHKAVLSSEDEDEHVKDGKSKPVAKNRLAGTRNMAPQSKMSSVPPASLCLSNADGSSDEDNVFLSPKYKSSSKSQEEADDCDDSVISVDSPLPLSERLKLRLLQNC